MSSTPSRSPLTGANAEISSPGQPVESDTGDEQQDKHVTRQQLALAVSLLQRLTSPLVEADLVGLSRDVNQHVDLLSDWALGDDERTLPQPRWMPLDLYEREEQEDSEPPRRYRAVNLPPDMVTQVENILRLISWSIPSAGTRTQYAPLIRNYFSLATAARLDPFRLTTLRDWIYSLAYPRLRYLIRVSLGQPPAPARKQPGMGRSSLSVAVAAIAKSWAVCGKSVPNQYAAWRTWFTGLSHRIAQPLDRKHACVREDLQYMVSLCKSHRNPLIGLRDQALLLLGWSAALRRSEIGAVWVEHIIQEHGAWYVLIPRSKTDQLARGTKVPIYPSQDPDLDPLHAWRQWLEASGIQQGPAFRPIDKDGNIRGNKGLTPQAVGAIVRSYAPTNNASGHSLRIGYVTQAKLEGRENWRVRIVSRHRSDHMLDVYTRPMQEHQEGPGSLL